MPFHVFFILIYSCHTHRLSEIGRQLHGWRTSLAELDSVEPVGFPGGGSEQPGEPAAPAAAAQPASDEATPCADKVEVPNGKTYVMRANGEHRKVEKAPSEKAFVRCCNAYKLEREVSYVGMGKYGGQDEDCDGCCDQVLGDKTYVEAATICLKAQLNLCTEEQMASGLTKGSGCGYDDEEVWIESDEETGEKAPPATSPEASGDAEGDTSGEEATEGTTGSTTPSGTTTSKDSKAGEDGEDTSKDTGNCKGGQMVIPKYRDFETHKSKDDLCIFRASFDQPPPRPVVVKVSAKQERQAEFDHECKVARDLNRRVELDDSRYTHLMNCRDKGQIKEGNKHYIALDYVGVPLLKFLSIDASTNGRQWKSIELARQLLTAELHLCHKNLTHGAISPKNVMCLDKKGIGMYCSLIDFKTVKIHGDIGDDTTDIGYTVLTAACGEAATEQFKKGERTRDALKNLECDGNSLSNSLVNFLGRSIIDKLSEQEDVERILRDLNSGEFEAEDGKALERVQKIEGYTDHKHVPMRANVFGIISFRAKKGDANGEDVLIRIPAEGAADSVVDALATDCANAKSIHDLNEHHGAIHIAKCIVDGTRSDDPPYIVYQWMGLPVKDYEASAPDSATAIPLASTVGKHMMIAVSFLTVHVMTHGHITPSSVFCRTRGEKADCTLGNLDTVKFSKPDNNEDMVGVGKTVYKVASEASATDLAAIKKELGKLGQKEECSPSACETVSAGDEKTCGHHMANSVLSKKKTMKRIASACLRTASAFEPCKKCVEDAAQTTEKAPCEIRYCENRQAPTSEHKSATCGTRIAAMVFHNKAATFQDARRRTREKLMEAVAAARRRTREKLMEAVAAACAQVAKEVPECKRCTDKAPPSDDELFDDEDAPAEETEGSGSTEPATDAQSPSPQKKDPAREDEVDDALDVQETEENKKPGTEEPANAGGEKKTEESESKDAKAGAEKKTDESKDGAKADGGKKPEESQDGAKADDGGKKPEESQDSGAKANDESADKKTTEEAWVTKEECEPTLYGLMFSARYGKDCGGYGYCKITWSRMFEGDDPPGGSSWKFEDYSRYVGWDATLRQDAESVVGAGYTPTKEEWKEKCKLLQDKAAKIEVNEDDKSKEECTTFEKLEDPPKPPNYNQIKAVRFAKCREYWCDFLGEMYKGKTTLDDAGFEDFMEKVKKGVEWSKHDAEQASLKLKGVKEVKELCNEVYKLAAKTHIKAEGDASFLDIQAAANGTLAQDKQAAGGDGDVGDAPLPQAAGGPGVGDAPLPGAAGAPPPVPQAPPAAQGGGDAAALPPAPGAAQAPPAIPQAPGAAQGGGGAAALPLVPQAGGGAAALPPVPQAPGAAQGGGGGAAALPPAPGAAQAPPAIPQAPGAAQGGGGAAALPPVPQAPPAAQGGGDAAALPPAAPPAPVPQAAPPAPVPQAAPPAAAAPAPVPQDPPKPATTQAPTTPTTTEGEKHAAAGGGAGAVGDAQLPQAPTPPTTTEATTPTTTQAATTPTTTQAKEATPATTPQDAPKDDNGGGGDGGGAKKDAPKDDNGGGGDGGGAKKDNAGDGGKSDSTTSKKDEPGAQGGNGGAGKDNAGDGGKSDSTTSKKDEPGAQGGNGGAGKDHHIEEGRGRS
eukprot:TRINITY_DN4970_c0_g1_i2.p1 TRINITY_DN4970_c0_g1~~TRINITY_DN4970_c0_g1_i2.p1  ORF type:complete len:1628 (+),score=348.04 TRINITY_DN4970_c0_g1_i2:50-4933(+)